MLWAQTIIKKTLQFVIHTLLNLIEIIDMSIHSFLLKCFNIMNINKL